MKTYSILQLSFKDGQRKGGIGMLDAMVNGPPVVEYEQIVTPVTVSQKDAALSRQDRHQEWKDRGSGRRRKRKRDDEDEILFEPFLGKLFDYSA